MRRIYSVLFVLLVAVLLVPSAAVQGATSYGNKAIEGRWFRDEYRQVNYWGPLSTAKNGQQEPYGGAMRLVQYFDKGRIEAKDDVNTTSGLLVVEMTTGQVQMGDATFMQQRPAEITAVGDAAADSPTYADLARTGKRQVKGEPVSMYEWERLERRWRASAIKGSYMFPYVEDPAQRYGQAVLPQFEAFALKIGASVPDVLGYPLTPPLIVYAPVAGRNEQLYIQAFERRVLTYNPSNPKEYEVEFGNIGQHYYQWRYSSAMASSVVPATAITTMAAPATMDKWTAAASMNSARSGHRAVVLRDGSVLLLGSGRDSEGLLGPVTGERYDARLDKWTVTPSAIKPHNQAFSVTLLMDGKVLVMGGVAARGAMTYGNEWAEVYDPAANAWRLVASMPTSRIGHSATLLPDGRVLVLGGVCDSRNKTDLYDPATDKWSPAAPMINGTGGGHSAILLPSGDLLVFGGFTCGSVPIMTMERYNPKTNAWTSAGMMPKTYYGEAPVLLSDGRILVIDGNDTSSQIYNPSTSTWSAASPIKTKRSGPTTTVLPNGDVLVAGGADKDGRPIASAERYRPASNNWVLAAPMVTGRADHSASLLPNGQIMVAGGEAGDKESRSDTALVERYSP